jgi:hypothetical protein
MHTALSTYSSMYVLQMAIKPSVSLNIYKIERYLI